MIGYKFNEIKPDKLYLIYNKVWNCYKYGVTSKSINQRINDYIKFKELRLCDVSLIDCINTDKAKQYENELHKLVAGYRFYQYDNNYPMREHFIDCDDKLKQVLSFFSNLK